MTSDLLFHHFGLPFGTLSGASGAQMAHGSEKGTSQKDIKKRPAKKWRKVSKMHPTTDSDGMKSRHFFTFFSTFWGVWMLTWSRMGSGTTFSSNFAAQITKNIQKTFEIRISTYVCVCIFVCVFLPVCLLSLLLPLQARKEFRRGLYLM